MNTPHTPGPWSAYNSTNGKIWKTWRVEAPSRPICNLSNLNDQDRHNAQLIAAAPDLLAAVVEMLALRTTGHGPAGWDDRARAAIAKAKGTP